MKARVWTTEDADEYARAIDAWWRVNRPAAPGLFTDEVASKLVLLGQAPDIGRIYEHPDVPGVRRLYMPRTKYHIYYVHDSEAREVAVLAIWSALRGQGPDLKEPEKGEG